MHRIAAATQGLKDFGDQVLSPSGLSFSCLLKGSARPTRQKHTVSAKRKRKNLVLKICAPVDYLASPGLTR